MLTVNSKYLRLWSVGSRSLQRVKTLGMPLGTSINSIIYNRVDDVYMMVVNGLSGSLRVISAMLDRTLLDVATFVGGKINCGAFHERRQEVCFFSLLFGAVAVFMFFITSVVMPQLYS